MLDLQLLVHHFDLVSGLNELEQPAGKTLALVLHKLVLLLEQGGVGVDEVQVVLGGDMVDPTKLLLKLCAVLADREVDVDHVVNHLHAVLVGDLVILEREREKEREMGKEQGSQVPGSRVD